MRKVFIDIGTYDGDSILWFIKNRPDSNEFKIFGFEPDIDWNEQLIQLEKSMPSVTIFNKAVWNKNTKVIFNICENKKASNIFSNAKPSPKEIREIETINIVDFLKLFNGDDYLILKIDAEGVEYDILDTIKNNGLFKNIKEIMIEFHRGDHFKLSTEELNKRMEKETEMFKYFEEHNIVYKKW